MSYILERSVFIPRPRPEVFGFFADAHNLERITPAFLHFNVLTPGTIAMRAGTHIDYELGLYGIRFRWKTIIEEFVPMAYFVDLQLTGPYRRWRHTHTFEDAPGGTQMHDRVEYEMRFGLAGVIARALFVRRSLDQIFDYRNETITKILGK